MLAVPFFCHFPDRWLRSISTERAFAGQNFAHLCVCVLFASTNAPFLLPFSNTFSTFPLDRFSFDFTATVPKENGGESVCKVGFRVWCHFTASPGGGGGGVCPSACPYFTPAKV